MDSKSTRSRVFSPGSSDGFSIVELLVAILLTLTIGGAALALALASRDMYETDLARTRVNQSLRSALDFLAMDIRQAGERLPGDFPVILVTDGASGAPDTLVVRRNMVGAVLPVCQDIFASTAVPNIVVAITGTTLAGCAPVLDNDANGFPDNIDVWNNFRSANGGAVQAFIYDPVTRNGEFFQYDAEDVAGAQFRLRKANSDQWQFDFAQSDGARVYLLEQKSYGLSGDLLQVTFNGDNSSLVNVVDRVTDFQVHARFSDGTQVQELDATADWTDLRAVGITIQGQAATDNGFVERTWASEFFPRNVLSR